MTTAARSAAAGFALGVLTVGGFAPLGAFVLPLITLAGLARLCRSATTPAQSAAIGFAFGWGCFLSGVSWVYVSLHQFGGMPAALAAVATVLFCAYLALYPAAAAYAGSRLAGGNPWLASGTWAAAWTLAEWLRGWVLTGFPWLAIGYSQAPPSPLAGFAPLGGVHALSFLVAFGASVLAQAWGSGTAAAARATIVIASIGLAGWGLQRVEWTVPRGEPVEVSLLQGNIEQSLKWKPERYADSLRTYLDLARTHPARLVVLPETAIPTTLDQLPADYAGALRAAAGPGADVLLGIVTREQERYWNSAVVLGAEHAARYDKSHLVPFGEFTPPLFEWTLAWLRIPMSNFSRGPVAQAPLHVAGQALAINICYEDVFGAEIRRGLPSATLLVNLSNTAWFGRSLAQPQHLQIAQLRALETGRTMLRATNTGMTAVVNARGRVQSVLEPFARDALRASVQGHEGATPYVRVGDAGVLAVCAACLAAGFAASRRPLASG